MVPLCFLFIAAPLALLLITRNDCWCACGHSGVRRRSWLRCARTAGRNIVEKTHERSITALVVVVLALILLVLALTPLVLAVPLLAVTLLVLALPLLELALTLLVSALGR